MSIRGAKQRILDREIDMNDWNKLILGEEDSQTAPLCNGTVREMVADIDRLKGELEEKICKEETATHNARVYSDKCCDLERQLSEARKETDRLRKTCDPETEIEACKMIASVKQEARQEAARECYNLVNTFAITNITFVLDAIKAKFKLEG